MKFAKDLEQDSVPEWGAKYLDYKTGKKKIKALARAARNVNSTPLTPGRRKPAGLFSSSSYQLPIQNRSPFRNPLPGIQSGDQTPSGSPLSTVVNSSSDGRAAVPSSRGYGGSTIAGSSNYFEETPQGRDIGHAPIEEDERSLWDSGAMTNYGSFVPSPPPRQAPNVPTLELPDPALSPSAESFPRHNRAWRQSKAGPNATPVVQKKSVSNNAYEVGQSHRPASPSPLNPAKRRNLFNPRRTFSTPVAPSPASKPPMLKRLFSLAGPPSPQSPDVQMGVLKEFDLRQLQFFNFLDGELEKVDSFYKLKENEATQRLKLLREQLHEMRDRRIEEVHRARRQKEAAQREWERQHPEGVANGQNGNGKIPPRPNSRGVSWKYPFENTLKVGQQRFGKNTKALEQMGQTSLDGVQSIQARGHTDSWRDFSRRSQHQDMVPYPVAKRKLKLALQEFYRGLELLKSFALLNRIAFRKINKKHDKAVSARPTMRYMAEKVNKSWFVQSEVLDGHIVAVEDLYARYFERGNHKVAVGKLRSKHRLDQQFSSNVFRNGIFAAVGVILGVQGLVYSVGHLNSEDATESVNTSYLLQLYGGYFLALWLFILFCLDCRVWTHAKINYVFIFEFDNRHNLEWRQLSEFACFFLFLLGLFLFLNFNQSAASSMYLYWPVVLVGLTFSMTCLPLSILYHRSREWFVYSNFRLLLAGLYPVEFRDFFLGDMFCSLTYTMGNIALFPCLYAHKFVDPAQCNSSHSRALGFLSALPGIWRALQCLRRYYDTRNAFPHLVNCGKYLCTILFYMSLGLYRINETFSLQALFIFFATINSIYTSIWDLAMDWSLCNPYAKNPFLRDVLGYKNPYYYYAAMLVDPLLRFNWIFYVIIPHELQHSAILSVLVSFSEICRRGIWTIFRVENEHCTNVGRFRALRDVPLPYDIPTDDDEAAHHHHTAAHLDEGDEGDDDDDAHRLDSAAQASLRPLASGTDVERASPELNRSHSGSLRQRTTATGETPRALMQSSIQKVGNIMHMAHAQDFERKKKPGEMVGKPSSGTTSKEDSDESSDEERDEIVDGAVDEMVERERREAADILGRRRSANGGGRGE